MSLIHIPPPAPRRVTALFFRGLFTVLRAVPFYISDRDSHHFKCLIHWHEFDIACQEVHVVVSRRGRLRSGRTYAGTGIMEGHKWRELPTINLRGISIHHPAISVAAESFLPEPMTTIGHGTVIKMNRQCLGTFNAPFENTLLTVAHERHGDVYEVIYYTSTVAFTRLFPNVEVGCLVALAGFIDGYESSGGRWIIKIRTA